MDERGATMAEVSSAEVTRPWLIRKIDSLRPFHGCSSKAIAKLLFQILVFPLALLIYLVKTLVLLCQLCQQRVLFFYLRFRLRQLAAKQAVLLARQSELLTEQRVRGYVVEQVDDGLQKWHAHTPETDGNW
jgi:hypothetical protein